MQIEENFQRYIDVYPSDIEDLKLLAEQLTQPDQDITSRKNFVGHVTASAFVVNRQKKQVLLLEHKALGKLLQPGGHVEPDDSSLLDATMREIEEETGLQPKDLTLHPVILDLPNVPFDIDTHFIPENSRKGEPGHYHHDFRYLYTTDTSEISIDTDESNGFGWIDWDRFANDPLFQAIADRIDILLEPSPKDFFRSIAKTGDSKKISVLAVSHIIPSSEPYILSLQENFNLIGIIPKPNSINKNTLELLRSKKVKILHQFTKQNIAEEPKVIADYLAAYDNISIVDIGGYFSTSIKEIKKQLGKKLLGVVEDTENGLQKYEKEAVNNVPVVSVARSPLKDYEDQLVGNGVAHAVETLLRELNTLITYKSCGIIGYGKVGRGIFQYLQQRGIRAYVCETDPIRAIQASCDGAEVSSIDKLLSESNIVFCATGSRAVDILHLRDLRRGAFLASVTSSDDEFDLRFIDSEYTKEDAAPHITRYSKRGHFFYLLNSGNAVNFLYSAAVDKYIFLVQGELVASILRLAAEKNEKISSKTTLTNTHSVQTNIAKLWLEYILRDEIA